MHLVLTICTDHQLATHLWDTGGGSKCCIALRLTSDWEISEYVQVHSEMERSQQRNDSQV